MTKVVVLGAGFSRAISDKMPLMSDLREHFEERLGLDASSFASFGGDVEAWLAHLGSEQPWLRDAENLRNRAMFYESVDVLYDVIITAQHEISELLPVWLDRLAWQWSHEQVTILTFNYDTLLEESLRRVGWTYSLAAFYAAPLTERYAVGSSRMLSDSAPRRKVPTVLKLHGSVNWWHGGKNAPLTEQVDFHPRPGIATRSEPLYADLQPLLVPPTSVKNTYYGRSGLATQWRLAAEALREAHEIDVIGYSFPVTDLPTRAFLGSSVSADARVRVVDPFPRENAASNALPGRDMVMRRQGAADFATESAGMRVSAWPTRDTLLRAYGAQEYATTGGRGPGPDRISTQEIFVPAEF